MSHTPGPWVVGKSENKFTHTIEADVGPVAFTFENYDANLIAAAPQMVDDLENVLNFLEENLFGDEPVAFQIRRTLAKALGEQA